MILTGQQVKEKLGIGDRKLQVLIESGVIKPINKKKEGAKKFFRRFNSADINKFFQEMRSNGNYHKRERKMVALVTPSEGINTRLARIEEKLDSIINYWK